ncbi:MAG TPA: SusD/RagB family nutrient-binding outer membrane lipoprotein [Puia sp.]|nr:SusD/RagB family nutrient-binding outer membrane lipoprotein [Puia sp.]
MTNNIGYPWLLIFLVACFFGSCKKWVDVNYDPSQLSDNNATPDLILPGLLESEGTTPATGRLMNEWMGYWCWPYHDPADPVCTYDIRENKYFPGGFAPAIDDVLFEENARKNGQPFYQGIAKFIKALDFSGAVDIYNDMPYREAYNVNIRTAHYDKGQFIYEDLMVQLDSAIGLIGNAPPDKALHISTADILCHGNKEKWFRVINTLKLRLLIHQANRTERQGYIQQQVAKIVQQGSGFLGTGEDASVNPGYDNVKVSPYFAWNSQYSFFARNYIPSGTYGVVPSWTAASANTTAMDLLKRDSDPRLSLFYNPAGAPLPAGAAEPFAQPAPVNFRGNRFGLILDQQAYPFQGTSFISQIGGISSMMQPKSPSSQGIVKGYDMDCFIITSVESLFLQAEAIYRGWLQGDAQTAYENAVRESFRWLNAGGNSLNPALSDNVFSSWYQSQSGNVNVSWGAAPDKYKLIMFQKYMALNGIDAFESYVDYRRNGAYPDIPLSYNQGRKGNAMPIRSPYPITEYTQNAANVNAEGPIDIFSSKIWWMP